MVASNTSPELRFRPITTVLITGASGFIGSHLCPALSARGLSVRGTRRRVPAGEAGLSQVRWFPTGEINEATDWSTALEGVDYVVHLIGVAHHTDKEESELVSAFRQVNVGGTTSLVRDIVRNGGVKRLLFLSSAKALGSPTPDLPPNSEYGRSKLAAEEVIRSGLEGSATDWCTLRPCLVYGRGNLGNMGRLVRLVDTGLPLPLGGIHNRKSFLFVGNLVNAIERALFAAEASRKTFTISDGGSHSTTELVRAIGALRPKGVRLFSLPHGVLAIGGKIGDQIKKLTGRSVGWDSYSVDRLCSSLEVDSTEFCEALQWHPPFTMDQGLKITLGEPASTANCHAAAQGT